MGALKINVFNYLDTSEDTLNYMRDYVQGYLLRTALFDVEDIQKLFPDRNAMLYVDFDIYMNEIRLKDVTIQDNLHRIDRERDSMLFRWILESDVLPYVNKCNKQGVSQSKQIRKDQYQSLAL